MDQIRCDVISFDGFDGRRQETWLFQSIPGRGDAVVEDLDPVHWEHCWDCQPCSYPDRTGDLRSIIKSGISTRPGSGIPSAPTATSTGRRGSSTI
jgi:hypothetical protein